MENDFTAINGLKSEHAGRVIAKLTDLVTEIESEGELWFGGLPPLFEELKRVADHRVGAIRQVFGLESGE